MVDNAQLGQAVAARLGRNDRRRTLLTGSALALQVSGLQREGWRWRVRPEAPELPQVMLLMKVCLG